MHVFPACSENVPLEHSSHLALPSVLDHPAGQTTHVCSPLSNVPGTQARVELQTPSTSQSTAVHPCAKGNPAFLIAPTVRAETSGPVATGNRFDKKCSNGCA